MATLHKWEIEGRDVFINRYAVNGIETMTVEEAEHRLNEYERLKEATEILSAEDAREYSPCIRRDCIAPPCECADALQAYADTLEKP